ncbi:MAG: hypothetical protein WEF50_20890 [Myxococcota bacterium]
MSAEAGTERSTWLKGFCDLFPSVAQETTKNTQDLAAVERVVSAARTRGALSQQDLLAIERSTDWTYGPWWPRLSSQLEQPVPIGDGSPSADRQLLRELQVKLKHIEVVSVLLRFTLPERFGIYSPPVAWLLGLMPREDQVRTYLSYRDVVRKVGALHGLDRVADVDMALWTAARPSALSRHRELRSSMEGDAKFQAIVLVNSGEGLSRRGRWTEEHRVGLARGILRHDPVSAGALAAPVFEDTLMRLARLLQIKTPSQRREGFLMELTARIDGDAGFRLVRARCPKLDDLRRLRNLAVHPPGLTSDEAREFISGLEALLCIHPRRPE